MKMTMVAVGIFLAGLPAMQPSQAATPTPGPEHGKMSIMFGEWKIETDTLESPLGPAGKVVAQAKVRSILGGFGMEWKSEGVGPNGPFEYSEIDGYDSFARKLTWEGYDSVGGSEKATYTIDGDKMVYEGFVTDKGKQHRIRGTAIFTPDREKAVDEREFSVDGKNWKPLSTSRWTKTAKTAVLTREETVEKEIIRLERIWTATGVNRDADALARLLADEVTSGTAEGKWLNKAQMLAEIRTGEYVSTFAEADDMKVRVYGNVAVITGRTTDQSRYKGVDSSGQYIWTDTWVLRDGVWLCVATHGSKVGTKIGH